MITTENLPETYVPYTELLFCSNRLINNSRIIEIGNVIPMLIGQGALPQVWLQAPTDAKGKTFAPLVVASVAVHPAAKVQIENGALSVYAGDTLVLRVKATSPTYAEVDQLDLRPIGYSIHGNSKGLEVGAIQVAENTTNGTVTFLKLG